MDDIPSIKRTKDVKVKKYAPLAEIHQRVTSRYLTILPFVVWSLESLPQTSTKEVYTVLGIIDVAGEVNAIKNAIVYNVLKFSKYISDSFNQDEGEGAGGGENINEESSIKWRFTYTIIVLQSSTSTTTYTFFLSNL